MTDDEWQTHVTREAAKAIGEWLEGRGRLHQPIHCLTMPELEAMAQKAADQGQPFLGGERFGPLDAYALVLLRWGGFAKIDPTGFRALWAHVNKVAQLPAVQRAIARERLELNLYRG